MKTSKNAFTLVELLVVIGIIAVLIGVLLPALNKARQQANLVSCQAKLREMGSVLAIYESDNKTRMPYAYVANNNSGAATIGYWWWPYTLGNIINKRLVVGNTVTNLSGVFSDVDTIEGNESKLGVWHFTCNPRLFYGENAAATYLPNGDPADCIGANLRLNRKVTDVKHASNVFTIWDAPQVADQDNNAYAVCRFVDKYAIVNNNLTTN